MEQQAGEGREVVTVVIHTCNHWLQVVMEVVTALVMSGYAITTVALPCFGLMLGRQEGLPYPTKELSLPCFGV